MRVFAAVVALVLTAPPTQAQVTVGLEVGTEWFSGMSRHRAEPEVGFRTDRPTVWGLRAEHPGGRVGVALGVHYARPRFGLHSPEVVIIEGSTSNHLVGASAAAIVRLATLQEGVRLRAEVGPVVERWELEGEEGRVRIGGTAGLSLEVGLGGRVTGTVTGTLGVLPSPLAGLDLPEGYEARTAWRRGVKLGVRARL